MFFTRVVMKYLIGAYVGVVVYIFSMMLMAGVGFIESAFCSLLWPVLVASIVITGLLEGM